MRASSYPRGTAGENLYATERFMDVQVPASDPGILLGGDLVLPVGVGPVPVLLTAHPYRKDLAASLPVSRWFAQRGYASLHIDLGGIGASVGPLRPPFSDDEADDVIAAMAWAVDQPWCDGSVGLWGGSYGAAVALRTAARRPRLLKAIVALEGFLDPEIDFLHPSGLRGGLAPVSWGTGVLFNLLTPPLDGISDHTELQRWRDRLDEADPFLLNWQQKAPGDKDWRNIVIDPSEIDVPALCFGGWEDLFCDATVQTFEQLRGPKRLIIGPWEHNLPDASPNQPTGFLRLVLGWWDRWLRGHENGALDEPPVTVFVQGAAQAWRGYEGWPRTTQELTTFESALGAGGEQRVHDAHPSDTPPCAEGLGCIHSDPTIGPLSGLWGMLAGAAPPQNQADDDLRNFSVTSAPLVDELLIVGRPTIRVGLANSTLERLVARLSVVDADGASWFICAGTARLEPGATEAVVTLAPTAYQFAPGSRMRLSLSDADFPRLWPSERAGSAVVVGLTVAAPVINVDEGRDVTLPPPIGFAEAETAEYGASALRWVVSREFLQDGVTMELGAESEVVAEGRRWTRWSRTAQVATVHHSNPAGATMSSSSWSRFVLAAGDLIEVDVTSSVSLEAVHARGRVEHDGLLLYEREWRA